MAFDAGEGTCVICYPTLHCKLSCRCCPYESVLGPYCSLGRQKGLRCRFNLRIELSSWTFFFSISNSDLIKVQTTTRQKKKEHAWTLTWPGAQRMACTIKWNICDGRFLLDKLNDLLFYVLPILRNKQLYEPALAPTQHIHLSSSVH